MSPPTREEVRERLAMVIEVARARIGGLVKTGPSRQLGTRRARVIGIGAAAVVAIAVAIGLAAAPGPDSAPGRSEHQVASASPTTPRQPERNTSPDAGAPPNPGAPPDPGAARSSAGPAAAPNSTDATAAPQPKESTMNGSSEHNADIPPDRHNESGATQEPTAPTTHLVSRGETLAEIALRYDVPFEHIATDNGIVNPNRILPGQHLVIRPKPADVQVIQPGLTLTDYARSSGRGLDELMHMNPQLIDPNRILAGGQLHI